MALRDPSPLATKRLPV